MTKKGIVLSIILAILLITIIISVSIQIRSNNQVEDKIGDDAENHQSIRSDLELTIDTGVNLEELKSYGLPIIIQIGTSENELCFKMLSDLEILSNETKGKAIIKYIDTKEHPELWKEGKVPIMEGPMQLLFNSDGTPYKTSASEALGYKSIKTNDGNHLYTLHDGDLTLSEMREILKDMGMDK